MNDKKICAGEGWANMKDEDIEIEMLRFISDNTKNYFTENFVKENVMELIRHITLLVGLNKREAMNAAKDLLLRHVIT